MRVIAFIAAAVVLVTGCSSGQEEPASNAPPVSSASVKSTAQPSTPAPAKTLTSNEVIVEFAAANLPTRNPRDNSANCERLGCAEAITTDDLSILVWSDPAAQKRYVTAFKGEAFSAGNVVLSYAAARTPAKMRPKYQAALTELMRVTG